MRDGGDDGVEVMDDDRDTLMPDPVVECFTRLGRRVKRPKSSNSITHYFNTHFLKKRIGEFKPKILKDGRDKAGLMAISDVVQQPTLFNEASDREVWLPHHQWSYVL